MTAAVQSQTMNDQFKYKGLNKISKHVEMKSLKHSPSQSAPTILVLKQNMGCKKQGAKKTGSLLFKKRRNSLAFSLFD